jgi:hypothetical protein
MLAMEGSLWNLFFVFLSIPHLVECQRTLVLVDLLSGVQCVGIYGRGLQSDLDDVCVTLNKRPATAERQKKKLETRPMQT